MGFNIKGLVRTAPNTGSAWLYILGILYFLLTFLCFWDLFQNLKIFRKFQNKSEGAKFRILILFFCGWLMLERFIMTFVPTVQNLYLIFLFHQSIPLYLQFAIFSSFVLFLTKIVYYTRGDEENSKKRVLSIYISLHLIILVGVFIYPWYMHRHVSMDNFHIGNFLVAMILYLILCIFSFFFVIKVYLVIQRFHFGYRRTVNVRKTLVIILIISSLYLIQAIYSFFAIINKNIIDSWSNKCFKTDNPKYYIYVFWNLTITEIAPCFMIWMVFHITLKRNTSRLLPESAHINKDNTNSEPESSDSEEEY